MPFWVCDRARAYDSAMLGALRTIRDWILTIPALLSFIVVLLFGDIALRVARLFGDRPMEVVAGWVQRGLIASFGIVGTRLEVDRSAGVVGSTGYLFIANHQSLFDIPMFGGVLRSNFPKYVAKRELGRWIPTISFNLRRGGNVLIDRANRTQAMRAIKEFGAKVQERGVSAVIFPEGSRSRDGHLKEFKTAGPVMLMKSADRLAVVPAAIDGSWKLLKHKLLPIPFGTRVRIKFLDPIERLPGEDPRELLERARQQIEATLEGWRLEAAAG